MLKETSWASAVTAGPRRKPSGHGLEHLEFAAELFLDADFSLAFLKLRARLSSLLKLLTLLRLGLARCGLSSGELAGSGERQPRGEGGGGGGGAGSGCPPRPQQRPPHPTR